MKLLDGRLHFIIIMITIPRPKLASATLSLSLSETSPLCTFAPLDFETRVVVLKQISLSISPSRDQSGTFRPFRAARNKRFYLPEISKANTTTTRTTWKPPAACLSRPNPALGHQQPTGGSNPLGARARHIRPGKYDRPKAVKTDREDSDFQGLVRSFVRSLGPAHDPLRQLVGQPSTSCRACFEPFASRHKQTTSRLETLGGANLPARSGSSSRGAGRESKPNTGRRPAPDLLGPDLPSTGRGRGHR